MLSNGDEGSIQAIQIAVKLRSCYIDYALSGLFNNKPYKHRALPYVYDYAPSAQKPRIIIYRMAMNISPFEWNESPESPPGGFCDFSEL